MANMTAEIRAEKKCIQRIVACFDGIKEYRTQFRIEGYRVDLCFIQDKIVVECDEFDHSSYNQEKEVVREKALKNAGYKLVRFNPFAKDFNISKVIRAVNKIMMENDPLTIPNVNIDPTVAKFVKNMIKESTNNNAVIGSKDAYSKFMKYCRDHDVRGKTLSKDAFREMISTALGTQMVTRSRYHWSWRGYEFTDTPYTPPPATIASAKRYKDIIDNLLDTDLNSLQEGQLDVRLLVCPAPLSNKGRLSEGSFNTYLSRLRVMQEVTTEFRPNSAEEKEFDYAALSFIMLHPKETLLALKKNKQIASASTLAGYATAVCKLFRCHPWAMMEWEAAFLIWEKYFGHYKAKEFNEHTATLDKGLDL